MPGAKRLEDFDEAAGGEPVLWRMRRPSSRATPTEWQATDTNFFGVADIGGGPDRGPRGPSRCVGAARAAVLSARGPAGLVTSTIGCDSRALILPVLIECSPVACCRRTLRAGQHHHAAPNEHTAVPSWRCERVLLYN